MSILARFATKEPTLCAVCQLRADGLAYAPNNKGPFIWICKHSDCIELAPKVYRMKKDTHDAYERKASMEAANAAGAFIDEIQGYDLRQLTEGQWAELWHRYDATRAKRLREILLNGEAPF